MIFFTDNRRKNAVKATTDDSYRDTFVGTVRLDGVDIPPYFIKGEYGNASHKSGRRPTEGKSPVKGMNNDEMKKYLDFLVDYIEEPSVLVMDRLSSHASKSTLEYARSKRLPSRDQALEVILLPPKTAFLVSPLDNGAFSAFKGHFYQKDRSTLELKFAAARQAWQEVSNDSLRGIIRHCGLDPNEELDSIRRRFAELVEGTVPPKFVDLWDQYLLWNSGSLHISGAHRGRGISFDQPNIALDSALDGLAWRYFRGRFGMTSSE